MAPFTTLPREELPTLAERFALGRVQDLEPLDAGTINSNYLLHSERGRFFVRINEGKSESEVASEAQLVLHLATLGVRTPEPRLTTEGRPWARMPFGLVTIFPWIDARPLCVRKLGASDCERAGALLAQVHEVARDSRVVRFDRYALVALRERLENLPARLDEPVAAAVADVASELELSRQGAGQRARLPAGVIHQDFFVDNVLEDAQGLWILDFEQAAPGPFVYDLAVAANAWGYGDALLLERVAALIRGYQSVRPLTDAERAAFLGEARRAAARFCLTRITDVELDPRVSPAVRSKKDYRRYHARLLAWRGLTPERVAALFQS